MAALTQTTALIGQRLAFRRTGRTPVGRGSSIRTRAGFTLPDLPYAIDALEPKISKDTLEFHWGKHHRTYVDNLNKQIEGKPLENKSLEEVVLETWNGGSPTPEFNNAAQAWNHTFYWESMSPEPTELKGELKSAIEEAFGSVEEFKKQFSAAGATQFGSGWAWLVVDNGKLAITKTPNAENPITSGKTPILTMDVWEHAYYLDTQNRRPAYIETFVNELINWDAVEARYTAALA